MRKFDFHEVVTILDSPRGRELDIVGTTGIVTGVSKGSDSFSYSVSVEDENYVLPESALEPTGRFADSDDVRPDDLASAGADGDPPERAFADYDVVVVVDHPDAAGLGLVGALGIVMGVRLRDGHPSYPVMIGEGPGSPPESYLLPEAALRSTGRRLSRDEVYGGEPIRLDAHGDHVLHPPW
jgi:Immunity protein 31